MDRRVDQARAVRRRAFFLALVPGGYLALFFVRPVVAIIGRGFSAGSVSETLLDGRLRHVVWFTTWQAVASTVLTMAVGLPAAFVLGRYEEALALVDTANSLDAPTV